MIIDPHEDFLIQLKQQIPLLAHMGITACCFEKDQLSLHCTLAPNINDKGTGFGGSLSALATLSGWALITLALKRELGDYDVVVRDAKIQYLAPVTGDFQCTVSLPEENLWQGFSQRLQQIAKARVGLQIQVFSAGTLACTMDANYTAIMPQ